jgi:acyl carrier protein
MVVKPREASSVNAAAHPDDSLFSATERAVVEVFAAVLNVQRVSLDDDIFALGGDSFEAIRVALELERRFQIEFPVELIESAGRVRDVAAWINARPPSHSAGD